MNDIMRAYVIGNGSWGTALAKLLCENGHRVTIVCNRQDSARIINETHENPRLPGVELPSELDASADYGIIGDAAMIVMATPSYAVRETADRIRDCLPPDAVLTLVSKGIEADTNMSLSSIVYEKTGIKPVILSGPSHAEEVSRGQPTGCVAASMDRASAEFVQDAFMNERFRVYSSSDVIGVELGGAIKNVIAVCTGICAGLGFGDNLKALLMTRGLAEIARLGQAMGASKETFLGLTGVGDLIATCTSMHSRNFRAGLLIGQGTEPRRAIEEIGAVVEGYYAAKSAKSLAEKTGVDMPITCGAYAVLYEDKPPLEALSQLMTRRRSHEVETYWQI